MNRPTTLTLHTSLLLVLLFLSIADCLFLKDTTDHSRHKRGFRKNAASRLAHGYGKRDYRSPPVSTDSIFDGDPSRLSDVRSRLLESLAGDFDDSPVMSTQEFTKLLQENEELAQVIVRKFIDINDDDIITSDELFRRVRE